MAASMMLFGKLQPHLLRLLFNRNGNIVICLSAKKHSNNTREENCDFFGIPENFELQHYRHVNAPQNGPTSTSTSIVQQNPRPRQRRSSRHNSAHESLEQENYSSNELGLVEQYYANENVRGERRRKRKHQMKSYRTNFGVVSVSLVNNARPNPTPLTNDDDNIKATPLPLSTDRFFQITPPSNKNSTVQYDKSQIDHHLSQSTEAVQVQTNNLACERIPQPPPGQIDPSLCGYNKTMNECDEQQIMNQKDTSFSYIESQYFEAVFEESSGSKSKFQNSSDCSPKEVYNLSQSIVLDNTSRLIDNVTQEEQSVHFDKKSNLNLFDEYYFGESLSDNKPLSSENKAINAEECEFNTIDDQYFGNTSSDISGTTMHELSAFSDVVSSYIGQENSPNTLEDDFVSHLPLKPVEADIITNKSYLFKKKNFEQALNPKPNLEEPATAFDLAIKIRNEMNMPKPIEIKDSESKSSPYGLEKPLSNEGVTQLGDTKLDSKGFRILSDQVLDLRKMPSMDIVDMLKKKVIFDHEDFMVIDKPYGLPSIAQVNDTFSLSCLLPALGNALPRKCKASDLHLIHGLDRDVSGAVMLAKNPEVAYMLRAKLKANEIIQRFWAITKGVPSPRKGLIDIPIGLGKVGNIYKMVLRPQYMKQEVASDKKTSKAPSFKAVTEFSVLSSHSQVALVECRPHTSGVKHQVRVHLSSGLNTPILGDHKYSHFSKLAPQKLDRSILESLKIRQAKVRHIALHLHCQSLVLPDYNSKTFVITSRLPHHFVKNMRSLKLSLPK